MNQNRLVDKVPKSWKTKNTHETMDAMKENLMMNEMASKRYSEIMFKDAVFDSKDESTSGMNELNLLQELTNFTNMKMLNKNRKVKSKHNFIHFEKGIN